MLFLYNPTAGKGRVTADLAAVLDVFTKAGYLTTVYPTQGKGGCHPASPPSWAATSTGGLLRRGRHAQRDGVRPDAAGPSAGAGLHPLWLHQRLRHHPAPAPGPGESRPDRLRDRRSRPWDIGRLNGRPFVYVAAFGAFTEVSYDTPQDLKNTFGHLAYVMAGIASLPSITPYHLRIECDDQVLEDDFFYGMVCNTILRRRNEGPAYRPGGAG